MMSERIIGPLGASFTTDPTSSSIAVCLLPEPNDQLFYFPFRNFRVSNLQFNREANIQVLANMPSSHPTVNSHFYTVPQVKLPFFVYEKLSSYRGYLAPRYRPALLVYVNSSCWLTSPLFRYCTGAGNGDGNFVV